MPAPRFDIKNSLSQIGELFRRYGYHGTTLSLIKEASGLGKGSLYHHFSRGKEEIAERVLEEVQEWFEKNVYVPLETPPHNAESLTGMFRKTSLFFRNGNRVCVPGSFALYDARDTFPDAIRTYFKRWTDSLARNLKAQGVGREESRRLAAGTVATIQGALVLARAMDNPALFDEILEQSRKQLLNRIGKK